MGPKHTNTELNDPAFWEWLEQTGYAKTGLEVWQEAARRAQEQIKKAFEAGFMSRYLKNWNALAAYAAYKEQS